MNYVFINILKLQLNENAQWGIICMLLIAERWTRYCYFMFNRLA